MNESTSPISSARIAFAAIVLAMLPAVLDQTILATALPTIAHDLGRLTDVSWVIAAYVVTAAASTPLWGKLGDRLGRKRMLQVSLAMFLAASAVCGVAQDMTWLIVSRAVQGAAAGGLMTLAMAAVGDLVSPRERGRYQGYIAIAFALATVVGPLIGGVLVEHASWRWVFYVNLPVGAVALAGLYFKLPAPEPAHQPAKPLDIAGAGLLAGSTIALMLACIWGGDRYGWGVGDDHRADRRRRRAGGRAGRARAARGRSDRAAEPAAHAPGGGLERRAVPDHRRAVLDHGVRPPVPADDDARDADPGRAPARADDGRHHRVDEPRGRRDVEDRALQALPDPRSGAHDRRARGCSRYSSRTRAGPPSRSAWCCSGSDSGWSGRC